uniref:Uncharacterized protein n=1 Tax=Peronospora matthiolae TaxID=2874970 RepID=A0AAV1T6N8_9STRA
MALYVLGKKFKKQTDFGIQQEINPRCSTVKSNQFLDVEARFSKELQIDIQENKIEARSLKYFARFNKTAGNYKLQNVMGHIRAKGHGVVMQAKNRTKTLLTTSCPK